MTQEAIESVINKSAVTTRTLFSDGGFSIGLTDKDCVRIDRIGSASFDIPRGHAWYERIIESTTLRDVASHHRELVDAFA